MSTAAHEAIEKARAALDLARRSLGHEENVAAMIEGIAALDGIDWQASAIDTLARVLVDSARQAGYVLTIEQRPLQPLAMGNYETVVGVRPARGRS